MKKRQPITSQTLRKRAQKKKTPKTSYEKLKAEIEKLIKEKSLTATKIDNLKAENTALKKDCNHLVDESVELKSALDISLEEADKLKYQLSVYEEREKAQAEELMVKEEESFGIADAKSLKGKLTKLQQEKESAIRKFDDEIEVANLQIKEYIVNLDNEKNILTN